MSSEISQNIVNITKDGVLKIVMSLTTQDLLTELSEFSNTQKFGKVYYKNVY